ncbi:uncharacterized protein LODBEIA_P61340 [Lodderomyces beijingensis]|uniref:Glutamine amidotransferase type-2 domain-containing protein n=1 Tax=Lodderomyces beijingensis TaxID=1775926 RepID=A0ABP0ZXR3_9ASCO
MILSDLLTKPAHSIINQSFDSRLRLDLRNPINGDGFGVGYYTEHHDPCVFKAITPAWNNVNLNNLSRCTESSLVFGHVRASTQGVLSETNCHPFSFGRLMFMHNGGVSCFEKIKKRLINYLRDDYFLLIQGSTDSECCFALFLDTLDKMGYDPRSRETKFSHVVLKTAILKTIELIKTWQVQETSEPSLLNFAATDGESVVVSRYITSKTDEAASLHFSTGSRFFEYQPGLFKMERLNRSQDVIFVASEPLTFERGDWLCVPTNTLITITNKNTVLMHPIEDEFYDGGLVERSSGLAMSKGLIGGVPKEDTTNSPLVNGEASNGVSLQQSQQQSQSQSQSQQQLQQLQQQLQQQVPPLEREGRANFKTAALVDY